MGHDRGAGIAWDIAARHPELAEQLVAMTVGHPNAGSNPSVAKREKSWYMLLYQFPIAEKLLQENNWRLFRDWLHNHRMWTRGSTIYRRRAH